MAKAISQAKLKRFMEHAETMKDDPDYPLFEAGIKEGNRLLRLEALTFLENKYLDPNLDVTTDEAKIILRIARELSKHLRESTSGH